ncbi:MAG: pyridoxal phosphate-dependent aminotransferase [Candidatus Bipolaricaulia bacterium]
MKVRYQLSERAGQFTESVIREMTRLCNRYGGINLAQGFPDFPTPEALKEAAVQAIRDDINQYAITWGAKSIRDAICDKVARYNGPHVDPETEITVCCGATEAMIASLMAIVNPGDEVISFEPFYENYGPDTILSGATPVHVPLEPPEWTFDSERLTAAFNERTQAIVINTPNNPTGKVFTQAELEEIAVLCNRWDVIAVTDEIYEHILYDGAEHISIASLPGMADRTITINSLSKTYSVTGWRIGYAIAAPEITNAIRKVHDFLTVGAPAPLQAGGAVALRFDRSYYAALATDYRERRDFLMNVLDEVGFKTYKPKGAYYIMTEIDAFGFPDDEAFAEYLVREIGVAVVPGSSFYHDPRSGRNQVRFAFCKRLETLERAAERLRQLSR